MKEYVSCVPQLLCDFGDESKSMKPSSACNESTGERQSMNNAHKSDSTGLMESCIRQLHGSDSVTEHFDTIDPDRKWLLLDMLYVHRSLCSATSWMQCKSTKSCTACNELSGVRQSTQTGSLQEEGFCG